MRKIRHQALTTLTVLLTIVTAGLLGVGPPGTDGRAAPPTATPADLALTQPVAYAGTVYLTFDDGPSLTWTPRVLSVLRKYGVKAVFFEVGQNVSWYPSITRSLRTYGNKIGNHTWSHPNLTLLSTASVTWQLNRMESSLGYRPRCVRPPGGATNARIQAIIAARGQRPQSGIPGLPVVSRRPMYAPGPINTAPAASPMRALSAIRPTAKARMTAAVAPADARDS